MADKKFTIKINGIEQSIEGVISLKEETKKLEGAMGSLSRGIEKTTSFSKGMLELFKAGTGIVSMFGGESEKTKKIMDGIGKVLTTVNALQEANNILITKGAALNMANAVQTKAAAIATALMEKNTKLATIAQRAFNLVAKANPYVLLATGAVALVGIIAAVISRTKEETDAQKGLNKELEDFKNLTDRIATSLAPLMTSYKKLQLQWNSLGDDLKAKKRFIVENKDEFERLGFQVDNVSDAENVLVKQTDLVVASFKARAKALAAEKLAVEKYEEFIKKKNEIDLMPSTVTEVIELKVGIKDDDKKHIEIPAVNKEKEEAYKELDELQKDIDKLANTGAEELIALQEIMEKAGLKMINSRRQSLTEEKKINEEHVKLTQEQLENIKNIIREDRAKGVADEAQHQKEMEAIGKIEADQKEKALKKLNERLDKERKAAYAKEKADYAQFYTEIQQEQANVTVKGAGDIIDVDKTKENLEKVNTLYGKYLTLLDYQKNEQLSIIDEKLKAETEGSAEHTQLLQQRAEIENNFKNKSYEVNKAIAANNKTSAEALKEHWKQIAAKTQEYVENIMTGVYAIFSGMNAILNDQLEEANEKYSAITEKHNELLEQQKASNDRLNELGEQAKNARGGRSLIIQEQINQEMAKNQQLAQQEAQLAKEKEKAEKEKEKKEKQIKKNELSQNIIQGVSNTALGVTKAWSLGPIIGPIMAALVGAAGAIQVAVMTKQLAKFADGGLLNGKRHAQGGMRIEGTNIEVEGGEYVVNRESTSKNLGLVRYINSQRKELTAMDMTSFFSKASQGYEPPFRRQFEAGGQVPAIESPNTIDNDALIDAIKNIHIEPKVAVTDIIRAQDEAVNVDGWSGI